MTTQEKDRIECAIRHIQTAVDVDPWAVEIAVEAMRKELSKNSPKLDKENGDLQPTCNQLATVAKGICVPCKDTISRQEAIDGLEGHYIERINLNDWQSGWNAAIDWVKDVYLDELPSAQPEPQWIPVSERLPEKYGNYLISIHGEDEPDIGTINPNDKRGWSLCDANGFHWASDKKLIVTAWMPLPEPYRAERRTDGRD